MSTEQQLQKSFKNASFRLCAYKISNRIFNDKAYPDIAVRNEIKRLNITDKQFISNVNELTYGVVRWRLKLDYLINLNLSKEIKKPQITNLLRIGAYQLLFMDGVKEHACINETVELAKVLFNRRVGNFVNAILRSIQRRKNTEIKFDNKVDNLSFTQSFPKWIIEYWLESMPFEKVEKLCESLNKVAGINLRVNLLKTDRDSILKMLYSRGISASKSSLSPCGINLNKRMDPVQNELYENGYYSVQDTASQIVSFFLDPEPEDKILDACSAPGGKSCHMAELMADKGEIIAVDSNKKRLGLLKKQIKRLGINIIKTFQLDLSKVDSMKNFSGYFNKILVDAPCSGLGTIRRNPDIKWSRKMSDIDNLAELQYKIMKNVAPALKPGGILVYSVCTLSAKENEDVIDRFLDNNPEFELVSSGKNDIIKSDFKSGDYFTSYSDTLDMDCFFAARIKKIV